mgnify:FL=1
MINKDLFSTLKKISIQQYKTDVGFRTLVESVNENLYIIPKYQRKYRWSKEQVVSLIESLICGLPIPPIYTCRNEDNQLEILDGQQRVMSLFFYYIGYYLNKKKNSCINFSELKVENENFKDALISQFELEELHICLNGENMERINVDYASLPIELKRRIDYTPITVIEIKIDDVTQKPDVLRQIFANLNRGGSLLSQQEQRNGIYACPFYDMLQNFNRNNKLWCDGWGREDAKEKDLEALLRLCALKYFVRVKESLVNFDFSVEGYNSSYVKLLDQFSEKAMSFTKKQIDEYERSIASFLELFQVTTKQASKVTLFESFFVVYDKLGLNKPITSKIYNDVLNSKQYISCARQGTVQMKSMNERWKVVYEIWNGSDR